MAYFDDVIAQRRADKAQEQAQESDFEPTATSGVRFKAVGIIVIGVLVCFSPFFPIGIAFITMGLLWLAACPTLAHVEEQANVEQKRQMADGSGAGCLANIWACIVMAGLLTIAGLIAMALGVSLMGGGA